MRSTLDGRIAGTGINFDNHDENENYFNKKVHVRLTNDYEGLDEEVFDKLCASLSGEVRTYFAEVKK